MPWRMPEEGPGVAGEGAVAQRLSELTPHPPYHGRHPIHEHQREPQSDGPFPVAPANTRAPRFAVNVPCYQKCLMSPKRSG